MAFIVKRFLTYIVQYIKEGVNFMKYLSRVQVLQGRKFFWFWKKGGKSFTLVFVKGGKDFLGILKGGKQYFGV